MTAFDHVLVLLSFVYALALTHLLSRIMGLYLARERVKFSALPALLALNAILTVFFTWLELWPFRATPTWDLLSIGAQFAFAVAVYFQCSVALPEVTPEGTVDLDAFYRRESRTYYKIFLISVLIAIASNFTLLKSHDFHAFWLWQLAVLPLLAITVLALALRPRWAQWTAALLTVPVLFGLNAYALGSLR
jgi:hypothetical protein